jgi:ribosomal protein S18 acetylase RimI-like enzyme
MVVLHILRAQAEDCNELTEICYKIKRDLGYQEYLLELWKDELTITPDYIRNHDLKKIINGEGQILGFGSVIVNGRVNLYEINHFWILPEYKELNVGHILLEELESSIPQKSTIKIVAHPNTIKFYQGLGYQIVGKVKSQPDGLDLPLLKKIVN